MIDSGAPRGKVSALTIPLNITVLSSPLSPSLRKAGFPDVIASGYDRITGCLRGRTASYDAKDCGLD